jgi:plastocyanin
MRRLIVSFAFVVALLAAGCGSSGGGGSATSPPASTPAPAASTSGGKAAGGATKVQMKNIQFDPQTVTVKKGSTVQWSNEDSVNHDVTKVSGPGPKFSSGSGNLASGDSYQQTFEAAGTIKYRCTIHPGMTGTIVVK